MWRCFVRDQARVPSVAGAVAPFFVTGTVFSPPLHHELHSCRVNAHGHREWLRCTNGHGR